MEHKPVSILALLEVTVKKSIVTLTLMIVAMLVTRAEFPIYDDGLFFRRFASNLLERGVWGWNPDDGPVHGNTSQLWQTVLLALTAIAKNWTILTGRLVLGACLLTTGWLLFRTYPKSHPIILLGLGSPIALATLISGMETATTLALGAALLALPRGAAIFTVLLYLARPDTLILSGLTLLVRKQWKHMAIAAGILVGLLGIFHWFYGSALPLSFAMKTGQSNLYDPHFLELSAQAGQRHLLFFGLLTAPLLWLGRGSKWILPALAFIAFHAFGSIDVMGLHGRFYAPCLPWVVAAAAAQWENRETSDLQGWLPWAGVLIVCVVYAWIPGTKGWSIGQVSGWTYAAYILATGLVFWRGRGAELVILGVLLSNPVWPSKGLSDEASVERLRDLVTSWKGLERAHDCLGADLHVYHSEIGVPSYYFNRVTDLGGLMNAEVHAGMTFDEMCTRDQPELIFLPHRNYRALNKEIKSGSCIKGYQRVIKRSSSPLFVRRDKLKQYRCKR